MNNQQNYVSLLIDRFLEHGIDHFFIAPGHRSYLLTTAIANNDRCIKKIGFDERSLGYMALGYSKKANKPCVVVTTSGTAVANLYPAVVEAYLSQVPLILLTADRPFEMRDCGANQTISQANIFANHINKSIDISPIDKEVRANKFISMIDNVVLSSNTYNKGPVHINMQFRDDVERLQDHTPSVSIDADLRSCLKHENGLILVGELSSTEVQDKIIDLAVKLGWPICADITSNMRNLPCANVIDFFDLGLLNQNFIREEHFSVVLKFGSRFVSKRILKFIINNCHKKLISINDSYKKTDPTGCFVELNITDIAGLLTKSISNISQRKNSLLLTNLHSRQEKILPIVKDFLQVKDNEASYCVKLLEMIEEPVNVVVSPSMPIRYLDQFAFNKNSFVHLMVNRGASGIDGLISTAAGVAVQSDAPTILLTGDLAFIYDTNGLMLLKQCNAPVLIVVINNEGGGIFHHLSSISQQVLTPYFDTPHQMDISSLCLAHDIKHQKVIGTDHFAEVIKEFFSDKKTLVVEVLIDKKENANIHKELYRSIGNLKF